MSLAYLGSADIKPFQTVLQQGRRHIHKQIVGLYEHYVPGKYGYIDIPFLVHGGLAAPDGRLVHNIVMHQGEIVEHLDSQCRFDDSFGLLFENGIR